MPWRLLPALGYALRGVGFALAERNAQLLLAVTALERLTDLASPEFHPLAGKAKDIAAGAVLVAMLAAVSITLVVFGPRLL